MVNSNSIVETELNEHLRLIEKTMGADALAYCGPIVYGIDASIKNMVESIDSKLKKLVVVLETTGGYIEVVERIAHVFRQHYESVDFIVPNYAMSAGTVLVMSGDAIHMDYFSVLGPIDPQVERNGKLVPALGYLEQFERLVAKSKEGTLTTAESVYMVSKFDPAEMYSFEQARELSVSLLKEWLVKYKFKPWVKTETKGKNVTIKMKEMRADDIARELTNTKKWHSHSRGISMETLRRDLKLVIEDFGTNEELNKQIRSYHRLLADYMMRRNQTGVIHIDGGYQPV